MESTNKSDPYEPITTTNDYGSVTEYVNQTSGPDYIGGFPWGLSEEDFLPDPLPLAANVTFIVLYVLIITSAILGNVLVIVVIATMPTKKRSVTDTFIVSLAVSDLLIACYNMPFQLYYVTENAWDLGEPMCKFTNYMQAVTIVTTIMTLAAIAIDRYFAICHPLKAKLLDTRMKTTVALVTVWLGTFVIVSPQLVVSRRTVLLITDGSDITGYAHQCVESFKNTGIDREAYSIGIYVFLYVLPTIVMLVTYGAVGHRLWIRKPIGDALANPRLHEHQTKQKKRLVKTMVMIVTVFCVCWFPFFTITLINTLKENSNSVRITMCILQLIGYTNCAINPVVYGFPNKSFQSSAKQLFKRFSNKTDVVPITATTNIHSVQAS